MPRCKGFCKNSRLFMWYDDFSCPQPDFRSRKGGCESWARPRKPACLGDRKHSSLDWKMLFFLGLLPSRLQSEQVVHFSHLTAVLKGDAAVLLHESQNNTPLLSLFMHSLHCTFCSNFQEDAHVQSPNTISLEPGFKVWGFGFTIGWASIPFSGSSSSHL